MSIHRVAQRGAALALLFLAACGDSGDSVGPPEGVGTLSGVVRSASAGAALEGATISAGGLQATSGADGRFVLAGVPAGAATVRCERAGYVAQEAAITIAAGANSRDFTLAAREIFEFGTSAVYVPAEVGALRGAIIVLGGPVASAFVTGNVLAPGLPPDVEASGQALGAGLRALAKAERVALFGSRTTGMENGPASDDALFAALGTAAQLSGHAELAAAPVVMYGISGGGPEASGLASRHPERAIGVIARAPSGLSTLTDPAALGVPTFVMLAELDVVVSNTFLRMTAAANRAQGGLWALALEPGVEHFGGSSANNETTIGWISAALARRLPAEPGGPLVALPEASGWLGNPATLEIAPWDAYTGDRAAASRLLSEAAAVAWRALTGPIAGAPPAAASR